MKTLKFAVIVLGFLMLAPRPISAQTVSLQKTEPKYDIFYTVDMFVTNPKGLTFADQNGILFVPDNYPSVQLNTVLNDGFWNIYPLYFAGDTLNLCVIIENAGAKKLSRIRVETYQEFLSGNIDGAQGAPVSMSNLNAWSIKGIAPGATATVCGSYAIPAGTPTSMIQTHLIVSKGSLEDPPGELIANDYMSSIWSVYNPQP
jgi:hypothetical protein